MEFNSHKKFKKEFNRKITFKDSEILNDDTDKNIKQKKILPFNICIIQY